MAASRVSTRSGFVRRSAPRAAGAVAVIILLAVVILGVLWMRSLIAPALVLTDIVAGAAPSPLKTLTAAPQRVDVRFSGNGEPLDGDLYLPGRGRPRAGVVLVPGVVPLGHRDPRLVAFAQTLARAGFAVLAPSLPAYRLRQVQPGDVVRISAAFRHLVDHPDWAPQGRAGMVAFSYAVGFAVLAALDPAIREQVRFVVGIGGYYDLNEVLTYATTGHYRVDGRWRQRAADPYGQWVFLESARPHLGDARDRWLLGEMARRKLENLDADLGPLARELGPEGRSIYRLLTNPDPAAVPARLADLPVAVRGVLDALTLHDKDLTALRARLILLTGEDDPLIPYTQSLALARAVPAGQAQVLIIHRVLGHVELHLGRAFEASFWGQDLPDLWRLYRAVRLLLLEQCRGRAA